MEKEWFYQPRETVECPGCGEKIKPGFAVCKNCGAILDRAKAAALGLAPGGVAAPVNLSAVVIPGVTVAATSASQAEPGKATHNVSPARR